MVSNSLKKVFINHHQEHTTQCSKEEERTITTLKLVSLKLYGERYCTLEILIIHLAQEDAGLVHR